MPTQATNGGVTKWHESSSPPAAAAPAVGYGPSRFASRFIRSIADLLSGGHDAATVILPFTVLRRPDGVLDPTKEKVFAAYEKHKSGATKNLEPILKRVAGVAFLNAYIKGFSESVRETFNEQVKFSGQVTKFDAANVPFLVVQRFADVELSSEAISNSFMESVFKDLMRRFAEQPNETAGNTSFRTRSSGSW